MTAPTGVYAHRNAGHKTACAARIQSAGSETEQLAAAYDWFRASARLLARRRPPRGVSQDVHRDTAARLLSQAAAHLEDLARQIDRGDYDARKGVTDRDSN